MKCPLLQALVPDDGAAAGSDPCWYDKDLSVEDLSSTVAAINAVVRANSK
jgi:hypothetical protein